MRLVGVDGIPMQVQGATVVNLKISNQVFQQEVIIAESLTLEGILEINFLEGNGCVLDLSKGELVSHGTRISLCVQSSPNPTITEVDVTVPQTFTVAPYSEMEVLGEIPVSCRGDWIVENKILKKPQVIVVRAVVVPQNGHIPMCMLNVQPYPVIVHKGTTVATVEECIHCNGYQHEIILKASIVQKKNGKWH